MRLIWGRATQAQAKRTDYWAGRIRVESGSILKMHPLGSHTDEAEALRLAGDEVVIQPRLSRSFDGCDLEVEGTLASNLIISLEPNSKGTAGEANNFSIPLSEVFDHAARHRLNDGLGFLIVDRAPGDRLRVAVDRSSMVFSPGEKWQAVLSPGADEDLPKQQLEVTATVRNLASGEAISQESIVWNLEETRTIPFEFTAPASEGAYSIEFSVNEKSGFAKRWIAGSNSVAKLRRTIELVVVDPEARLPRLSQETTPVLTIDPAKPGWWQRLPKWARRSPLPGVSKTSPLGNTQLRKGSQEGFVSLPASDENKDPNWQAFTLPVRQPGQPHVVEIALPSDRQQHLAISILEPDASGNVQEFGRDTGAVLSKGSNLGSSTGSTTKRLTFWPRTSSPVLLVVNRSKAEAAEFGRVDLSLVSQEKSDVQTPAQATGNRMVAAYLALPKLVEYFGAPQRYDASTGVSVDTWQSHLLAANRLAQQLHAGGYNAAVVTISAEGSTLAPIASLGDSPRYQSAKMTEVDVMPRDVLEVLLRVFDREGLKLIPAVQLSHALPALESLKSTNLSRGDLYCLGPEGRAWHEDSSSSPDAGPRYNLLSPFVQQQLDQSLHKLVDRYRDHPALGGLALQVAGDGYGTLPGVLWCLDDRTVARFAQDTGIAVPAEGPQRFARRAEQLGGENRPEWLAWRQTMLSDYYVRLANSLRQRRSDWNLLLCTDRLLTGPKLVEGVQQSAIGKTSLRRELAEVGINLPQLSRTEGILILRPRRFNAGQSRQQQSVAGYLNEVRDLDIDVSNQQSVGTQVFHEQLPLRLPSFDRANPFSGYARVELASPSLPSDDSVRKPLTDALAEDDPSLLVTDLPLASLGDAQTFRPLIGAISELPLPRYEVSTEKQQPLTTRIYREPTATTICFTNVSPWPCKVEFSLQGEQPTSFKRLGSQSLGNASASAAEKPLAEGILPVGRARWSVDLAAYDIAAWRFDSKGMRFDSPKVQLSPEASRQLSERIAELEDRLGRLDVRRTYPGLKSPGFEIQQDAPLEKAWQVRLGRHGSVDFKAEPRSGKRALRLVSADAIGVAAESNSFAIPNTGRVAVSGWYRLAAQQPQSRLYLSVEYSVPGGARRLHQALPPTQGEWTECELVLDELAATEDTQLRVQLHLTGQGEAAVDDLELFDLQFDTQTRIDLAKRVFAAKTALEKEQYVDCLRLVDGYLPRYLLANVPGAPAVQTAETQSGNQQTPEKTPRLTDRFRQWTPRLWR
ncbi:MAG: hypothetical protein RH917_15270 [Lacipirellulaceae bacterium]